uniref:Uncharacterized protein n=1 Tax=Sinocyclocheilus rhinocerous TaxID=307959 RepID=A0A673L686_9TELE
MALTAISLLYDHSGQQEQIPIKVTVTNKFANTKVSYPTAVTVGMPMFGVLNKLKDTNNSFTFTYSINKCFGIYLESVNGLAGSTENHTYWELLFPQSFAGIGCYQPKKNENFIMNFTTWD